MLKVTGAVPARRCDTAPASPASTCWGGQGVPADVLNQIGLGAVDTRQAITGQPALTADGKPLVVYIGRVLPVLRGPAVGAGGRAARFGTFTGLGETKSSTIDVPRHGHALLPRRDVHQPVPAFQGVETFSSVRQGDGYAPLDTPTAARTS